MAEQPEVQGEETPRPNPLKEIIQPFIDVIRAPRALWGINLAYFLEGMVYFGMLGYLAIYFSDNVFKGVSGADEWSHTMVMVLTAGITISMVLLGFVADRFGVRRALLAAFTLLLAGRVIISAAPTVLGLESGLWSPLHLVTMGGILLVVVGYGMYQPAAYAAIRQFTTPKTAAMGFAMLYALMNLGGYLPSYAFLLRSDDHLGLGIPGTFWVYTGFTVVALVATFFILSRKTVEKALAHAREETARIKAEEEALKSESQRAEEKKASDEAQAAVDAAPLKVPRHVWIVFVAVVAVVYWKLSSPWSHAIAGLVVLAPVVVALLPTSRRDAVVLRLARHPLADVKFFYFIFALIPVQTLFTYNWLVLPQYINRSFTGFIGEKFEFAANLNPILIFIMVPIIAALTSRAKVYPLMIIGTIIMAAPAFLLAIGPFVWTLFGYIIIMTIGEAIWQPRFLQYAAEIAPEGRTGEYMGVAQLPWFLTKLLVPLLYSGWMMDRYCPVEGEANTRVMWFIFACIAMLSPIMLVLGRNWIGKDFKTRS